MAVRDTIQARSSVVEHYLDTVGVGSSILPAPTQAAFADTFVIVDGEIFSKRQFAKTVAQSQPVLGLNGLVYSNLVFVRCKELQ